MTQCPDGRIATQRGGSGAPSTDALEAAAGMFLGVWTGLNSVPLRFISSPEPQNVVCFGNTVVANLLFKLRGGPTGQDAPLLQWDYCPRKRRRRGTHARRENPTRQGRQRYRRMSLQPRNTEDCCNPGGEGKGPPRAFRESMALPTP